jgi:hypothetical protein
MTVLVDRRMQQLPPCIKTTVDAASETLNIDRWYGVLPENSEIDGRGVPDHALLTCIERAHLHPIIRRGTGARRARRGRAAHRARWTPTGIVVRRARQRS